MKKRSKTRISGYNELLAIKNELRKKINKQEESLNADIFSFNKMSNGILKFFTARKHGKKAFNNDNVLVLSDLLSNFVDPFIKDKKKKDVIVPVASLGVSVLIINLLNSSLQQKKIKS